MLFFVSVTEKKYNIVTTYYFNKEYTLNKASLAGVFGGVVKDDNNKHFKMIFFAF